MKQVSLALLLIIVMSVCSGHHDDSKSTQDVPENLNLNIPDSLVDTSSLILLNPNNNDFNLGGRLEILMTLQQRLKLFDVIIPIKMIVREEGITGLQKRLIKIHGLDSLITIIPEGMFSEIKSNVSTNHPTTILIDSTRRILLTGDIMTPSYKQRIYDYCLGPEQSAHLLIDTIVKISQNPDTFIYIKNFSPHPLVIYEIESSCDCSQVRTDDNIVAPYDSVKLNFTYIGNNRTKTLTNILIYSNDKDGIREIKVDSSRKLSNNPDE